MGIGEIGLLVGLKDCWEFYDLLRHVYLLVAIGVDGRSSKKNLLH